MDSIPFAYASAEAPLIVAEGRMGSTGTRVSVIVDTGASPPFAVFVSAEVAARLALAQSASITPSESTAIGPKPQSYRTAKLTRFELGPVALGPVDIAVLPMIDAMSAHVGRRIDAIIGYEFLKQRTVSIDYRAQRIDLAARHGDARRAIDFVLGSGKPLILVPVRINGSGPFVMEVDTGATGSTLSPAAAASAGVDTHGQGRMTGAGGQIDVGVAAATVGFGGIERALDRVAVSDSVTAIGTAAGTRIDGILGTDFFRDTVLTIDYPGRRLWLDAAR